MSRGPDVLQELLVVLIRWRTVNVLLIMGIVNLKLMAVSGVDDPKRQRPYKVGCWASFTAWNGAQLLFQKNGRQGHSKDYGGRPKRH